MIKTECGVYGIFSVNPSKSKIQETINGLKKLQHRGQESWGIGYLQNSNINIHKEIGYVRSFDFQNNNFYINTLSKINTNICIGHVRYSTSGEGKNSNNQLLEESHPLKGHNKHLCKFAICHNGNIPNKNNLINKILPKLYTSNQYVLNVLNSMSDTQLILYFLEVIEATSWINALKQFQKIVPGVYCLILMTPEGLYAIRDCYGLRPLILAISNNFGDKEWCITSESAALIADKYTFRDIEPGEIIQLTKAGLNSFISENTNIAPTHCIFEYVYFLRGNSKADGYLADDVRYQFGIELGKQEILDNPKMISYFQEVGAIVSGVPTTGIASGKGYTDITGLEYYQFIKKNHKMGRTFILQNDVQRQNACWKKYIIDEEKVRGREVILVDDSIVRGNTLKIIIKMFINMGAKAIHIRVSSSPVKHPCYFGVDIPTYEELVGHKMTPDEICKDIGANSLLYIKYSGMTKAFENVIPIDNKKKPLKFCGCCFNGNYDPKLLDW